MSRYSIRYAALTILSFLWFTTQPTVAQDQNKAAHVDQRNLTSEVTKPSTLYVQPQHYIQIETCEHFRYLAGNGKGFITPLNTPNNTHGAHSALTFATSLTLGPYIPHLLIASLYNQGQESIDYNAVRFVPAANIEVIKTPEPVINSTNTFYLPVGNNLVLDPAFAVDRQSLTVLDNLFETLVTFRGDKAELAVASSYKVSEDGLRWTFELRKDARWSDGTPVTSYDFMLAWQRLMDVRINAPNRYLLIAAHLTNALEVSQGRLPNEDLGVIANGDHELILILDKPVPWLLSILASPVLAPIKYVDNSIGGSPSSAFVSNGAYSFVPNANYDFRLVKNPYYWNANNVSIEYILADSPAPTLNSLVEFGNNKRSIVYSNLANNKELEQQYQDNLITKVYPETKFLEFNLDDPITGNLKIRQAINLLLDRQELANNYYTTSVPTSALIPSSINEANLIRNNKQALVGSKANYQQAQQLLHELGYSPEFPLTVQYIYSTEFASENRQGTVVEFHKQLARMLNKNSNGMVKLEYFGLNNEQYFNALRNGAFQITSITWRSDYNHATSFLNLLLSEQGDNYSNYNSARFDHLLQQASITHDPNQRAHYYAQAHDLLMRDLPLIPILWSADSFVVARYLKNLSDTAAYLLPVKDIKIDPNLYNNMQSKRVKIKTSLASFYKEKEEKNKAPDEFAPTPLEHESHSVELIPKSKNHGITLDPDYMSPHRRHK